jgi:hypothetical protein
MADGSDIPDHLIDPALLDPLLDPLGDPLLDPLVDPSVDPLMRALSEGALIGSDPILEGVLGEGWMLEDDKALLAGGCTDKDSLHPLNLDSAALASSPLVVTIEANDLTAMEQVMVQHTEDTPYTIH